MSPVELLNVLGVTVAVAVAVATIRLGVLQARVFRQLTGDDSALVSVLSLSRARSSTSAETTHDMQRDLDSDDHAVVLSHKQVTASLMPAE